MPVTTSYPGVYIEEIPSAAHPITGAATSITGFVGWAAQGPVNQATLVQSWSDYQRIFGGLDSRTYLGYAVQQFFGNGGQQAYVVRLVATSTMTGVTPAVAAQTNVQSLTFDSTTFPGTVTGSIGGNPSGGWFFNANSPGAWANYYGVTIQPNPSDYTRFSVSVFYVPDPTQPTKSQTVVETFNNLSFNSTDPRYAVNIISEQSNYVTSTLNAPSFSFHNNGPTSPPLPPPNSISFILGSYTKGVDGTVLTPATAANNQGNFEVALAAAASVTEGVGSPLSGVGYLSVVDFDILVVPALVDQTSIMYLQQFCFQNRAFLIVDSLQADTFTTLQNGPNNNYVGSNAINSAFYFPWIQAPDPLQGGRPNLYPPSGFVAGKYAATDSASGVWKAPAGIDVGIVGASGFSATLTDLQNGTLNKTGINCLRNFPAYGNVVWGARTLNGNDLAASQWKYVPVRRLSLYIEKSLLRGTQWVVFEPNDASLWSAIRLNINAFMQGLFKQGAFFGSTPQEAYFVKCDSETTTQTDISNGVVNILVGFAPVEPAEFVVIQIQQIAGQTQS
jgi:hypothetical protein